MRHIYIRDKTIALMHCVFHITTLLLKNGGALAPVRSALHSLANAMLITRAAEPPERNEKAGGANRDRTDDLLLAKQALSQLSYGPVAPRRLPRFPGDIGGSGRSCTCDLTLIRGAL